MNRHQHTIFNFAKFAYASQRFDVDKERQTDPQIMVRAQRTIMPRATVGESKDRRNKQRANWEAETVKILNLGRIKIFRVEKYNR